MGQRKTDAGLLQDEGTPKKRAHLVDFRRAQSIGLHVGLFVLLCWALSRLVYGSVNDAGMRGWRDFRTRWVLPLMQPLLNFLVGAFLLQVQRVVHEGPLGNGNAALSERLRDLIIFLMVKRLAQVDQGGFAFCLEQAVLLEAVHSTQVTES